MNILDLRNILKIPSVYKCLQNIVRNKKQMQAYVDDFIKIKEGDSILDIGCGPADILYFFPNVDYIGFDADSVYINNAEKNFKDRGQFFCKKVSKQLLEEMNIHEKFDIVTANNILHHLDDKEVTELFEIAKHALKPGGRLITCDGCKIKNDNIISKLMLFFDRGKYVRKPKQYTALASKLFNNVNYIIRNDLSNIPITGIIIECKKDS